VTDELSAEDLAAFHAATSTPDEVADRIADELPEEWSMEDIQVVRVEDGLRRRVVVTTVTDLGGSVAAIDRRRHRLPARRQRRRRNGHRMRPVSPILKQ
jgi:hypothetical protein